MPGTQMMTGPVPPESEYATLPPGRSRNLVSSPRAAEAAARTRSERSALTKARVDLLLRIIGIKLIELVSSVKRTLIPYSTSVGMTEGWTGTSECAFVSSLCVIPTGGCRSGGIAARPRAATAPLACSSRPSSERRLMALGVILSEVSNANEVDMASGFRTGDELARSPEDQRDEGSSARKRTRHRFPVREALL